MILILLLNETLRAVNYLFLVYLNSYMMDINLLRTVRHSSLSIQTQKMTFLKWPYKVL